MEAVELFSGTDSVGSVLRAEGWGVVSVDNGSEWKKGQPWGSPTHKMDVREFFRLFPNAQWKFGWASVPCHKFSVSVIGRNWTHDHEPKNQAAADALQLLKDTVAYLEATCEFFLIENPRGKMRRVIEKHFPHLVRYETAWCRYRQGEELQPMKPSDLFGKMPPAFNVLPPCRNGDGCHIAAERGSQTGTQGNELRLKGMIPANLVRSISQALKESATVPAPFGVGQEGGAVSLWAAPVEGGPLQVVAHSEEPGHLELLEEGESAGAVLGRKESVRLVLEVLGEPVAQAQFFESGKGVPGHKAVYTPRLDNPLYTRGAA